MPEIGEVARAVHFIRKHLVGKRLAKVTAFDDASVYGKAGTSAAEFQKHMSNKTIVSAGQQGKYFYMIMSSPPHPVMHFAMTGWLEFNIEHSFYYQPKEGSGEEGDDEEAEGVEGQKRKKSSEWPPRWAKFVLVTDEKDPVEAAFVDKRRFARIRLVNCDGNQIRNTTPLKENGPDPVLDKEKLNVEWLKAKCASKKVPVKAMLLDQANISGIGNWVGDEIMYNAKIHPEQYANTLSEAQVTQLHKSLHYVCGLAVEVLADSTKFPDDWLFRHRWGKGKKDVPKTLPTGERIAFLTVGGRTSAVIPSVQKKTGPVAKDMDEAVFDGEEGDDDDEGSTKKKKKTTKKNAAPKRIAEDDLPEKKGGKKSKDEEQDDDEEQAPMSKKYSSRPKSNDVPTKEEQPNGVKSTKALAKKTKPETEDAEHATDTTVPAPTKGRGRVRKEEEGALQTNGAFAKKIAVDKKKTANSGSKKTKVEEVNGNLRDTVTEESGRRRSARHAKT